MGRPLWDLQLDHHILSNMATMDEMKDHSHVIDTEINSPIASDVESVEAAGSRESFLSTFTPEEDKAIMRKVDRRFLLLIGILYLTKNVRST